MTKQVRSARKVSSACWTSRSVSVVERGGGLVEQQERRVLQQRAGDREALFLAAGETDAALAGDGVESFRHLADEVRGVGGFEGGPEFVVGGVVFREQEVFAQGGVEEEAFLGDVADVVAQPFLGERSERMAVEQDAALVGFVEAGEQVEHGGFPGAGGADQGDGLAGLRDQRDAADGGRVGVVGKGDVLEPDVAGEGGGAHAFGEVGLVGQVEDVEDALRGDDAAGESWVSGLIREMGSNRKPQATRKAITVPASILPCSTHHAPKATIRMMPDSAMNETPGQTIAWPFITRMCFSPTWRLAMSKRSSASGSTV